MTSSTAARRWAPRRVSVPFGAGPTPVVPEVPLAVLLPLAALAVGAGAYGLRRRTHA